MVTVVWLPLKVCSCGRESDEAPAASDCSPSAAISRSNGPGPRWLSGSEADVPDTESPRNGTACCTAGVQWYCLLYRWRAAGVPHGCLCLQRLGQRLKPCLVSRRRRVVNFNGSATSMVKDHLALAGRMSLWKMLKRRPELCLMVRPACTCLRAVGHAQPRAHTQHAADMEGDKMKGPMLHIMLFCLREFHAPCSDTSHVCGAVYQRIEFRHSGARLRVRNMRVFSACPLFCWLIHPWMNVQNWTAAISPFGSSFSHLL